MTCIDCLWVFLCSDNEPGIIQCMFKYQTLTRGKKCTQKSVLKYVYVSQDQLTMHVGSNFGYNNNFFYRNIWLTLSISLPLSMNCSTPNSLSLRLSSISLSSSSSCISCLRWRCSSVSARRSQAVILAVYCRFFMCTIASWFSCWPDKSSLWLNDGFILNDTEPTNEMRMTKNCLKKVMFAFCDWLTFTHLCWDSKCRVEFCFQKGRWIDHHLLTWTHELLRVWCRHPRPFSHTSWFSGCRCKSFGRL